jgi:DNA invertase Pin-like site-specific DNA recombinase
MSRFVAYYRVSTKRQGASGLGLDAQREAVRRFVGAGGELVAEFEEVESGKRADRPALDAALRECRLRGATLLIAKLDRLSRSVAFLSRLMDDGTDFRAVDVPEANRLLLHVMAAMAEHERTMISERTKAALQAARDRGVRLGGRRAGHRIEDHGHAGRRRSIEVRTASAAQRSGEVHDAIIRLNAEGVTSLKGLARALNGRSVPAPRGGTWSAGQVKRVVDRAVVTDRLCSEQCSDLAG